MTAAGGDALVVAAPHQGDSGPAAGGTDTGLTYPTVYGIVPLSIGTGLSFGAPTTTASAATAVSSKHFSNGHLAHLSHRLILRLQGLTPRVP